MSHAGEHYFKEVIGTRKGRGNKLCEFKVGVTDEQEIVLRALDEGGVPPIVALLDVQNALELIEGLKASVEAVRAAKGSTAE